MKRFIPRVALGVIGLLGVANVLACDLTIQSAWIRQAPPGATTLAAYATLRNTGKSPLVIAGISTEAAGTAMLHETKLSNDMAQMRPIESLRIPPGGKVVLSPMGKHIMLMDLRGLPRVGDVVRITIKDAAGCTTAASFAVRALGAAEPGAKP